MIKAYTNARIFTGSRFLTNTTLLTDGHTVLDLVYNDVIPVDADIIDLHHRILAPAFIDLQIYGGNKKLFSNSLSVEAIEATRQYCMAGGASRFYITLSTNSLNVFYRGIDTIRQYWAAGGRAMPGLHLEGPYLNPLKRGAHLEKFIRTPEWEEVRGLVEYGKDVIRIMTIAPEQCDDKIIRLLLDSGITVSAGHSNANYRQATDAFNKGIKAATHLFNAMSPLQHREPGLVGAIYDHPSVCSSIIPDGIHVDFAVLRISKKIMGDRLFMITDAVTETIGGDYPHILKEDRYVMPDGTLSGSALTMVKGVQNLVNKCGIPLEEALRMASLYPARVIGMGHQLGKLEKGYAAEMVVMNDDFSVERVIVP